MNLSASEPIAWPFRPVSDCLERVDVPRKIQAKNFLDHGRVPIVSQEAGLINGYWDDERDAVRVASPVVIFGDHTQVLKLVDFDFVVGADGVKVLNPKPFLNASFLKYFLEANPIPSLGYARHFRHVSGLSIPLPPLNEQKRIVAKLDQAFAALDRARVNAEANLADAEALFDGWLTSVFHDHPASWRTEKLHSLCNQITVGHVGPMAERYTDSGVPFLRSQNIRPFKVALADVKWIDEQFHSELAKSALAPGDVAIVRTGYPGTAAVIPEDLPVSNCADLVIARPKKSIAPEFLVMFLNSTFGKQMVAEKAVGAAQKHFNVGAAKQVDFSFPDVAEQERLVLDASELRAYAQNVQASYRAKIADIATLRQSVLQAAFSGQLS